MRAVEQVLPTVDAPDCGFPSISVQVCASACCAPSPTAGLVTRHPLTLTPAPPAQTLHEALTHGPHAFGLARCIVVDARYGFEYRGGHVRGALNLTTPEEIERWVVVRRGAQGCACAMQLPLTRAPLPLSQLSGRGKRGRH